MKKRILSLLLAFLMAFSSVSTSVFAVDTVDENAVIGRTAKFTTQFPYLWSDPTNASSQIIVSAEALPEVVRIVSVHYFGTSTILYEIEAADGSAWPEAYKDYRYVDSAKLELLPQVNPTVSIVDKDGNPIGESGIFLPEGEKITVSAQLNTRTAATYQWQICYNNADGLWADLYGATNAQLPISGAMLRNVVDYYGKTFVRCVVTSNGQQITSDSIPVTMTAAPISYRLDTSRAESGAHYDEVSPADSTVKYAITVLFKYADTEQVWTSYLTQGQDYILDLECPDIPGYIPENGQNRVTRNITNIQENITIVVQYVPDFVDFVVEHYWQYVDKDDYELHETQTVSGLKTGEFVGANLHKTYTGFDNLNYDSEITVAADGSTVVKIYYDREYFMVSVNLNGGFGAEPICARYGAPIVIPDPQRKGYVFSGWQYENGQIHQDLPATVPAENTSYTAQWTVSNTNFTVAFYYENPNDTDFTFVGSVRKEGLTGDPVNGYDYRNESFDGRDNDHFTYKTADSNVTIKADGSTVVNVYFSRNTYTLQYKQFVCLHTGKGQHTSACCSLTVHSHSTACCTAQHIHNQTPGECCSLTQHPSHTTACCNGSGHVHTVSCASNIGEEAGSYQKWRLNNKYDNPYEMMDGTVDGQNFVYLGGKWWNIGSKTNVGDGWAEYNNCAGLHTHGTCNTSACSVGYLHSHGSGCNTSKCGKTAHDHSSGRLASCNLGSCSNGGKEHNHSSGCNSNNCAHVGKSYFNCACAKDDSIRTNPNNWVPAKDLNGNQATYSFKYGQNIGNTHANMGSYRWSPGVCAGYPYVPESQDYGLSGAVGMVISMPGGNSVFYRKSDGAYDYTVRYWLETYDGTGTLQGNRYFVQTDTFYPSMGGLDYNIDYVNGVPNGFDLYQQWACDSDWEQKVEMHADDSYSSQYLNFNFYYIRKTFTLTYFNGSTVAATATMKYDEPLTNNYNRQDIPMVSPYGSGYTFGGWYLDPECTVEVSWGSTRMQDGGLALYAKWVPVQHKVSTYLTKGGNKLANYDIYHGEALTYSVADPVRTGYNFVGWFYEEDGEEKAYDFSMPVYKDMELYAKWTSDTFVTGNIYYKDTQGNILADFIPIRGTVGDTKTYNAKVGDALNLAPAGVTYFPNVTSHSVTFSAQIAQNDFTFLYTAKEKVKYEVHFIDKDTGAEVAPTVTGDSRSATLVFDLNEQNISVKKYTVDAMRKTFSLSADESLNKFYFYFTKDEENATVQVEHYIQNTAGTGYTLYFTEPTSKALIGSTVTASPLTVNGFAYNPSAPGTVNGVTLPETGIVLKLYYTRNTYPYQFRFVYLNDKGQEVEFADSRVSGTALYGVTMNQVAKSFPGYKLTSAGSMSITVAAENPASSANIRTFYYEENQVTIRYQLGAGGGGTLSSTSESIKALTGQAIGSTASANTNYVFVGWYTNFACTEDKKVSSNAAFVPSKTDGAYTATTYYAKFEEVKVNIHYGVIMPAGAKGTATLSKASESVSIFTGRASGSSILTIPAGYAFEGWYDANGNKLSDLASWIPTRSGEQWVDGTIYYAKFIESEATIILNVGTVGGGTVQLGSGLPQATINKSIKVWTGTMEIVTAAALEGFHFVGWYKDGVLVSTEPVLQLTKTEAEMWTSGTYTAHFERNDADLTIYASGADAEQTYLFVIVGDNGVSLNIAIHGNSHVTVRDLPAGVYTVTEQSNWSWRQDAVSSQSANLNNGDQTLTFTFGEVENDKWLSGSDYLLFLEGGNQG